MSAFAAGGRVAAVDLASLIRMAVLISMMLLVLSLGLRASPGQALCLFRQPGLLVRSIVAMYVVMPLVVIALVLTFDLRPVVKMALVALALSPVPPFLPGKQLKLVTGEGYVYGLLVAASLLAVVIVPVIVGILGSWLGFPEHVTAGRVLQIVAFTVLIPLVVGMLLRSLFGEAAARASTVMTAIGAVLLVVAFIPVLLEEWPAIRSLIGDGTLLAIIVVTFIGLLVGHLLGGASADDRTVLALATASRHPAVAIAIASAAFPQERLVPAAVLLALIVGTLATIPYTTWRKRQHPKTLAPRTG